MTIRRATLEDKEQIARLVSEFDEYFANKATIEMYHRMGFLDYEITMVKPL